MPVISGLEWTFDTVAESYERLRPAYPAELYRDIFAYKAIDENCTALEIGIGGGQATLPVLQTGCMLTAVEYGRNLTQLCREKFAAYGNFKAVNCKFEDFVREKSSLDFVYSASAFHWIPEELGYRKVFELLKSGGVFARFANHPYKDKGREALHCAIQELYAVYMPDSRPSNEYSAEQAQQRAGVAEKYGFADTVFKLYSRTRSFSAEQYTQLLNTYSDHVVLEPDLKREFFSKIADAINSAGGQITLYDTVDLQLARKP